MKRLLITIFLIFNVLIILAAPIDTIRNHIPDGNLINHAGNFDWRVSRFDLRNPGILKNIIFTMDGSPGSFTLRTFGQEGGTAFPQIESDLMTPIVVEKINNGLEKVNVTIPEEVYLNNNKFFIVIENISEGTFIKFEINAKTPYCTSSNGGNYFYLYNRRGSDWFSSNRALAIDVLIERKTSDLIVPFLEDVTDTLDIIGGGNRLAIADYNNDGYDDILTSGRLLKNDFKNSRKFVDMTQELSLKGSTLANLFVDIDNDKDLDLLFLEVGDSSFIYLNNGQGIFEKKFIAGIPINSLNALNAVSISDVNNDGYLDLFVGQLWSNYPNALSKYLFINNKQNDFVDQSDILYADQNNLKNAPCRGSQFVDINNDGYSDLYVSNYVTTASKITSPRDELWLNNQNGSFTNVIHQTGIDTTIGPSFWNMSSGCQWGDYNNDGFMDLLASCLSHQRFMNGNNGEYTNPTTIYQNNYGVNHTIKFENKKDDHGIQYEETHGGVSWGDINNDGLLDFFISTYYGCRYNDIYIQKKDHTFELVTWESGVHEQRGDQDGLWFDFYNDGKLDLLTSGKLFKNNSENSGNYVFLQLESSNENLHAVGAKIIAFVGDKKITRELSIGHGKKMQTSYKLHFGIGLNQVIDSVRVIWPNKHKTTLYSKLFANNHYLLKDDGSIISSNENSNKTVVYPNPFKDKIIVNKNWGDNQPEFLLQNEVGQKIQIFKITKNGINYEIELDKGLAAGNYILKINHEGESQSFKLVRFEE